MTSIPEPTESAEPDRDDPPAPPEAPREITGLVRRRSWAERQVRVWLLLGVVMLVIASYYAISRVYYWGQEARLISRGVKVEAEIMGWEPGVDVLKGKVVEPTIPVDIRYDYKGQMYRPHGLLAGHTEQLVTRTMIPIYIDPADPTRWTARTEPASLMQELLSAMLLAPFVVILFALALWKRAQVLRTYRDGEAALAEVVGIAHSAMAPRSRQLRCAVHSDDADARVIRLVLPLRLAPRLGELLWVIYPPRRIDRAIPAVLFE